MAQLAQRLGIAESRWKSNDDPHMMCRAVAVADVVVARYPGPRGWLRCVDAVRPQETHMRRSLMATFGFVALFLVVALLLKTVRTPARAQSAAPEPAKPAAASAAPAPPTPWGAVDLQGIWTRDSDEPLQRPAKYANKAEFTDEERAAIDQQIADIVGREANEDRRDRGTSQDVGGAYNSAVFTSHLRTGRRTSMIVDPPDGKIPPITAEEQSRRAAMREYTLALMQATSECKNGLPACAGGKYVPTVSPRRNETPPGYIYNALIGGGGGAISRADGPEDRGLTERCMAAALPDFGGFRRIVQSKDQLSIVYDVGQGQSWIRTIPITNAPHVPKSVQLWWGDSRARWEGSALVVDVTNFSPKSSFMNAHENLHLVEKWERVDAETLRYTVTITDPTVWTKPWTVTHDLKKQSDEDNRIYPEPRCHEGNHGMAGLLIGARQQEKAFAAGKGPNPGTMCIGACGGFAGGFADEGEDANPLR